LLVGWVVAARYRAKSKGLYGAVQFHCQRADLGVVHLLYLQGIEKIGNRGLAIQQRETILRYRDLIAQGPHIGHRYLVFFGWPVGFIAIGRVENGRLSFYDVANRSLDLPWSN